MYHEMGLTRLDWTGLDWRARSARLALMLTLRSRLHYGC